MTINCELSFFLLILLNFHTVICLVCIKRLHTCTHTHNMTVHINDILVIECISKYTCQHAFAVKCTDMYMYVQVSECIKRTLPTCVT